MAQITLTFPDGFLPRLVAAVCAKTNYQEMIPDPNSTGSITSQIPNPVTRSQWTKQQMIRWMRTQVIEYESTQDASNAANVKAAEVEGIPIT